MSADDEPIRIPITDVFDLHTVRPKEVEAVVEAYLEEANRLGLKALRIIHGRGIGVQRHIVRSVLARTPFVLSYGDAPMEANRLGLKALRIIHGRGIGVQRRIVRSVLARTPYVLSFGDAPMEAGGWGATIVTLR